MKTSKLLIKQLVVAEYNLTLESNFLIFLNDEFLKLKEDNIPLKKIQKWIYTNSKVTSQLSKNSITFPLKTIFIENATSIFFATYLKAYFNMLIIKYANNFIQIKKLAPYNFFYLFSLKSLYYTLFVITKLFIFKKCILS